MFFEVVFQEVGIITPIMIDKNVLACITINLNFFGGS
jgi:hypothetical protein